MSAIAADLEQREEPVSAAARLARPRVRRAVGVAGLVVGLAAGLLVATSGQLLHPVEFGVQIAIIVVGTTGIALYWSVRRPGNRIALVLLAYAAAIAAVGLQGASSPQIHSIGVLAEQVAFLLGYYVIFIFPEGRLRSTLAKLLLAGIVVLRGVPFLQLFLFSPSLEGAAPLARCGASCPSNGLVLSERSGVATALETAENGATVFLAAAIVLSLCYWLATASAPRRRALLPVYVPALLFTVPFGVFRAAKLGWITLTPGDVDRIGWFVTVGRTLLTFGFLLAVWQATLFAGVAMKTILGRLGDDETAAHLQELVAEVLDDPPLELAFKVERGSRSFVDARGTPTDVVHPGVGRSATALRRRGDTVAYMLHDSALETDPELVQAAGHSVLLALENGRLEAELRSRLAELQDSRGRIVTAADHERLRLERDLHDGAQQRLMAIQIKLALLRDRLDDPELVAEVDQIGDDAASAVDELRGLAHGIYPTVLRERGLADALLALARKAPSAVDVIDDGIGRCDPAVEAAIYFCAAEAIQNATKHAGPGARVVVSLERRDNEASFTVFDDGSGFDLAVEGDGIGFVSMRDRMGALGGVLEIVSASGHGTTIRGRVPARGLRVAD